MMVLKPVKLAMDQRKFTFQVSILSLKCINKQSIKKRRVDLEGRLKVLQKQKQQLV